MPGLRLHHPTLRSCTYLLHVPGYPSAKSQGGWRKPKVRHLHIDANGDTIIATGGWEALEHEATIGAIEGEFIFMNEVPDPPKLGVGMETMGGPVPTVERQINDAIRSIAPQVRSFSVIDSGKYRPEIKPRPQEVANG